ncbi:MAG: ribonuclease HIII [Chlamydiae bacterium]|nr:ribonuclease HIII [Chlamydiota bacterium]
MSNCFVCDISKELFEKIETDLSSQGFVLSKPNHTIFQAKKTGLSCTLYQSGKFTVQGKEKEDFIKFYLEPNILENLSYSHPEMLTFLEPHIGVDEAGKGDVFGPLCVASVFADEQTITTLIKIGIKDSKRLSDETVMKKSKEIMAICPHKILAIHPEKYNELYEKFFNLNHLLAWGHATVIDSLYQETKCDEILIDQFTHEPLVENALKRKALNLHLSKRTKAEDDVVVAAASILARAKFLELLAKLGEPYHLALPKGASKETAKVCKDLYKTHGIEALQKTSKIHFKTVQEIIHS